jgi:molybdopterin converting factor small subunit
VVVVKFTGTLGIDLGMGAFELDLAGGTLADVIDLLIAQCGVKVREELLDADGNLDYAYGIYSSDGEKVDDLTTRVQNGAELLVINMIGGG